MLLVLTLTEWIDGNATVNFPVSLGTLTYGDSVYDYTALRSQMIDQANAGTAPTAGTVLLTENHDISFGSPIHCDSVIHLTVNVINNYTLDGTADICANQTSYVYRDSTYTAEFVNNDYDNDRTVALFSAVNNADSLQNVVLYRLINQHPMTYSTERREACDTYTWNGTTYGEGLHDGSTKTYYGYETLTNRWGCDSVISLVLNIHYNTNEMFDNNIACDTAEYTFTKANVTRKYTASGIDTASYLTSYTGYSMKCPSVDTVRIRVAHPTDSLFDVVACDSYKWSANNVTYKRDTNLTKAYTRPFTDDLFGDQTTSCNVVDTLHLVVNYNSGSKTKDTACDVYTWTAGAYLFNSSMASRYNKLPIPPTVMLRGGNESYLAVKGETLEDLVRNDI